LKKNADEPCVNLREQGGCSIYDIRPSVCRTWYCGWRLIPSLADHWRPDQSKLLIRFDGSDYTIQPTGISHISKLLTDEALELIGGMIASDISVSISIPTKPGFCSANATLNQYLGEAVEKRDLHQVRSKMRGIIFKARHANTDPIPTLE
jgi:hypothetical protein